MPKFDYSIPKNMYYKSSSPYWVLAVVPMKNRFTIDMQKLVSFEQDVTSKASKQFPANADTFYLLDSHCVNWSVQSNKGSHIHSASFTLVPPEVIYEKGGIGVEKWDAFSDTFLKYEPSYNIAPQDWVMFWAMDDEATYKKVRQNVIGLKGANFPESGLKFVGKVESFSSIVSISENGTKTTRYSMECSSFREFNNGVYFNPLLFPADQTYKTVNDLVSGINEFLVGNNSNLYISTQDAIFKLTSLFFDVDFQKQIAEKTAGKPEIAAALSKFADTSRRYVIPNFIIYWLDAKTEETETQADFASYGSILYRYAGVQQIGGDIVTPSSTPDKAGRRFANPDAATPSLGFTDKTSEEPEVIDIGSITLGRISKTSSSFEDYQSELLTKAGQYSNSWQWQVPLSSDMIKQSLHFDNRPIWSVLTTYLNEPVDELFTTLKLTKKDGNDPVKIMPSIICRQLPFSSTPFANNISVDSKNLAATKFVDLPKWTILDSYIMSYKVGLSDSMDINYVHLQPFLGESGLNVDMIRATTFVTSPPIIDYSDIAKNGLRMYQRELSSFILVGKDQASEDTFAWWNALMADIMMRMKYTASGTVVCKGISEPICVGDNAQVYNTIFHIESVVHDGGIDISGKKRFNTTLGLTMGITPRNATDPLFNNSEFVDHIPDGLRKPPPSE